LTRSWATEREVEKSVRRLSTGMRMVRETEVGRSSDQRLPRIILGCIANIWMNDQKRCSTKLPRTTADIRQITFWGAALRIRWSEQ
jgi:hypothetical protein